MIVRGFTKPPIPLIGIKDNDIFGTKTAGQYRDNNLLIFGTGRPLFVE